MVEKMEAPEVFFCARCGHSHARYEKRSNGVRLYEAPEVRCDTVIEVIPLADWRARIGRYNPDRLTDAGRTALESSHDR